MKVNLETGDVLTHRASGQDMVFVGFSKELFEKGVCLKCKYLNRVTGRYEEGNFLPQELTITPGVFLASVKIGDVLEGKGA